MGMPELAELELLARIEELARPDLGECQMRAGLSTVPGAYA